MGNEHVQTQMSQHETNAQQSRGESGGTGGTGGTGQGGQGQGSGYGQTGQTGTHEWDTEHGDDMTRGDQTDPAQPDGTTPLERDQRPINQSR